MYNLDGLLADGYQTPLGIDVAKMLQYDWMHTLLVAGCWNIEAGALVAALKPLGHTQKNLHDFLSSLTCPSSIASHAATGKHIFRKKHKGNLKCSASEGLGVYSCIRAFLTENNDSLGSVWKEVASYSALCSVLDVMNGVRMGKKHPNDLSYSINVYVKAHQRAYSTDLWVPKYHYLQHIPEMILAHGVVVGCFVHERKHRVAKRYAENMRNVGDGFDLSILKDVLHANLHDLSDKDIGQLHIGLVQPIRAPMRLQLLLQTALQLHGNDVFYSRQAHYAMGSLSSVDDFVVLHTDSGYVVGQVLFFASVGLQVDLVCVSIWGSRGANHFENSDQECFFDLTCIDDCMIYRRLSPTRIVAVANSLWL